MSGNEKPPTQTSLISIINGDTFKSEIAKLLPEFLPPEKLARVAITQLRKTPALGRCDQASFLSAMMDSASCGLVPDGHMAHLIPYGRTCQFITDWKGLVALGMKSPDIKRWRADVVCMNDEFDYDDGTVVSHKINPKRPRGNPVAFYSNVTYTDGTKDAELITLEEAEAVRDSSSAGKSGPWQTHLVEMGKKTAVRKHSKRLMGSIQSSFFDSALERDADVLAVKDITEEAGMAEALDIESKLANQELLATPTPPAQPESAPEKKEPAVEQTPDDEFIFDSVKPIRAKMPD